MADARRPESGDVDRIFAPGGAIEAFEAAKQAGKCRFFGFTGHYDPAVHLAMLKAYDKWDSILMPLHAADPAYLSFEKTVLPAAAEKGIGIQAMKVFGNAFLLRVLNAEECLRYVLSLPIHCATVGCSTGGQLDDDVRFAQSFTPFSPRGDGGAPNPCRDRRPRRGDRPRPGVLEEEQLAERDRMEPRTAEGVENVNLRVNSLLLTRFPHARPGKSRPEPSVVGAARERLPAKQAGCNS